MVFNFVAASLPGVAISYAIGQAAPMVAAIWGIVVWKEFSGSSARATHLPCVDVHILCAGNRADFTCLSSGHLGLTVGLTN
jgi:glucose uptake protein GlcU